MLWPSLRSYCLLLAVLIAGANAKRSNREILELMKGFEDVFKRVENQNITLIMSDRLAKKKDVRDYFFNEEDFIGRLLHHRFPREFIDRKTGELFYEYPRFRRYRNKSPFTEELQLFHNMLLKAAGGRVKLLFVMPFEIDWQRSINIVYNIVVGTHKAFGVTDAEVFKHNMGVIGTGYIYGSGGLLVQNRRNYIEKAGKELQKLANVIRNDPEKNEPSYKFITDFLNILTEQENYQYSKITTMAFHERDRLDINEKVSIREFIDKLKFSEVPLNNFTMDVGIQVAKALAEEINEATQTTITEVGDELIDTYTIIDDENMDLVEDYNKIKNARTLFDNLRKEKFPSLYDLAEKMAYTAKEVDMDGLAGILKGLLDNQDMMKDLEAFTETSLVDSSQWMAGLDKFNTFLRESEMWSSFLIKLYEQLPMLIVDNNIDTDEYLSNIYPLLLNDPKHTIKVRDLRLDQLLVTKRSKRSTDLENSLRELSEMEVPEEKIYPLITTVISSNFPTKKRLVNEGFAQIIGKVVKSSEVAGFTNNRSLTQIDVFVTDTFIVDVDLNYTGKEVTLNIIANKWRIEGYRRIILEGEDAPDLNNEEEAKKIQEEEEKRKKEEDKKTEEKGNDNEEPEEKVVVQKDVSEVDGAPGLPGGPGGHFLGIAVEMEGGSVAVSTRGGKGGAAVDGVKGEDGADGAFSKTFNRKRFQECTSWFNKSGHSYFPEDDGKTYYKVQRLKGFWIIYDTWHLKGTDGKPGQRGGNGGKGGIGGNDGNLTNIAITDKTKFIGNSVDERNGRGGKGMPGGKGGRHAQGPHMLCMLKSKICIMTNEHKDEFYGTADKGGVGQSNDNTYRMKQPRKTKPFAHYKAVNRFKMVIRELLSESIRKDDLMAFLEKVESHPTVNLLYNHLAFIDELKTLEEQFHIMYNHIDLLPFYESLLKRIETFSDSLGPALHRDIKLSLVSTYTATFSKVCLLKNDVKRYMIVDVHYFLSKLLQEIKMIEKVGKEVMINNHVKEYTKEIEKEVQTSYDIITQNLVPEIEATLKEIETHWEKVKEEIENGKKQEIINDQQAAARARNSQLRQFLALGVKAVMNEMMIIVDLAKEFSKVGGKGGGKMFGGKMEGILKTVKKPFDKATELVKGAANGVKEGLFKMKSNMADFAEKALSKVKKGIHSAIDNFKIVLTNITGEMQKYFRSPIDDAIAQFEKEANELLDYTKKLPDMIEKQVKNTYQIVQEKSKEVKQFVNRTVSDLKNKIISIAEKNNLNMETVLKFINNLDIDVMKEFLLTGVNNLFDDYDGSLSKINAVTSGNFVDMEKGLKSFIQSAAVGSPVELTVSKSKMKRMLTDVKFEMKKMLQYSEKQEDIDQCFERLISLADTIMDIFEKIQNNQDQMKLANLQGNLQSAQNVWDVSNPELYNTLNNLEYISKTSNLIVDYNRALDAFKQYVFPFADHFLAEFSSLPSVEVGHDLKDLLFTIIPQIEKLYSTLDDWIYTITPHDTYIFRNVYFTDYDYIPFYRFPYSIFNATIKQLFLGKPLLLKPDLRKGVNEEAVKFNKIGINFKLHNSDRQKAFDKALAHYDINMVHWGNNYYRCGYRYFTIFSEELSISYSYARNMDREPLRTNSVYDKIAKNDFFLSPYAFWTIELENVVDDRNYLEKFLEEPVDLLLEGVGQYVEMNDDLAKVCKGPLRKYYTEFDEHANLDDIIIQTQTKKKN